MSVLGNQGNQIDSYSNGINIVWEKYMEKLFFDDTSQNWKKVNIVYQLFKRILNGLWIIQGSQTACCKRDSFRNYVEWKRPYCTHCMTYSIIYKFLEYLIRKFKLILNKNIDIWNIFTFSEGSNRLIFKSGENTFKSLDSSNLEVVTLLYSLLTFL